MIVSDILATEAIPHDAMDDLCAITGCKNGIPSIGSYEEMLKRAGFATVAFEQKTPYTLSILQEKASRKGREAHYSAICQLGLEKDIDTVSGSFIISASKNL